MKGATRNKPCPCGSGVKRKHCEPGHPDLTPGMTPDMEQRRALEEIVAYAAARRRGRLALTTLTTIASVL